MSFCLNPDTDALFLDIDGTLLDIAPSADEVVVPSGLVADLKALYDRLGGCMAFVSGRPIASVDALFAPLHLPAAGVHGAESRLLPDHAIHFADTLPELFRQTIMHKFLNWDGVTIEDKGQGIALHYRQKLDLATEIAMALEEIVENEDLELKTIKGRAVFEVTMAGINKGTAVEAFMKVEPFKGRRPLFVGDDTTDLVGIQACQRLGGEGARVGHGHGEEDVVFASPVEVRAWIKSCSLMA